MKKILIVTGSRADLGLLEWPIKKLQEEPDFEGQILNLWGAKYDLAFARSAEAMTEERPDLMLCLGDRFEILAASTAAHLLRIPIAHIGGGDETQGSYDDAMRDCISRVSHIHFVTSTSAMSRLSHLGHRNIHLVGNPGIDYIRHADWKRPCPYPKPYVVVSYQAETIDGTNEIGAVMAEAQATGAKRVIAMLPNPDRGSDAISSAINACAVANPDVIALDFLPHDQFLNLLFHCDLFLGNSSSMLYEAPELGVKVKMVGKRQRGRTIPFGDGFASERIVKILRYAA